MPFTGKEKAFCVLEYARTQSNKNVQCAFERTFPKNAPTAMQIWTWHKKFKEEGCLCRAKGSGRPPISEEMIERVRETFLRSPRKSIRSASLETQISPTTVWRVARKHLRLDTSLTGATTPSSSEPVSNDNKEVLHSPQISTTGASPSDSV